jgi:transposase InsO family protein
MHPSIPSPCRLLSLYFECLALYIPFPPQVQAIFVRDRSQFTAEAFTDTLRSRGVAISMDGKGRWMDNVFIERLWKSVKYEDILPEGLWLNGGGEERTCHLFHVLQRKTMAPKL